MIAFPEGAVPATIAGIIAAAVILLACILVPVLWPHTGTHQVIRVTVRAADHGTITRKRTPDRQPWDTAGLPVLPLVPQLPALDEEAAELARAGYVRERIPVMGEKPQLEVLAAVKDAVLTPGVAEAQRLAKRLIA